MFFFCFFLITSKIYFVPSSIQTWRDPKCHIRGREMCVKSVFLTLLRKTDKQTNKKNNCTLIWLVSITFIATLGFHATQGATGIQIIFLLLECELVSLRQFKAKNTMHLFFCHSTSRATLQACCFHVISSEIGLFLEKPFCLLLLKKEKGFQAFHLIVADCKDQKSFLHRQSSSSDLPILYWETKHLYKITISSQAVVNFDNHRTSLVLPV